jgi:hypothetical protein
MPGKNMQFRARLVAGEPGAMKSRAHCFLMEIKTEIDKSWELNVVNPISGRFFFPFWYPLPPNSY